MKPKEEKLFIIQDKDSEEVVKVYAKTANKAFSKAHSILSKRLLRDRELKILEQ